MSKSGEDTSNESLETVDFSKLNFRNETYYKINSEVPFTGKSESYYKNGQKEFEGKCKAGKPHGLHTRWYENGQKKAEINYKDGEQDGLYTRWYEDGQKEAEDNYKDRKQHGLQTGWYENGQKKAETDYIDGKELTFFQKIINFFKVSN